MEKKERYSFSDFADLMRFLRSDEGCPWDRVQTHQSIRRNFLEETYEVLDTLDRNDIPGMREELGDVLMQILFHALMEEEQGHFTVDDVVNEVAQKLVFRHPHLFSDASASDSEEALLRWEELKKKEKGYASTSDAIEAIPHTLPALWRAEKINSKTIRAGFNWSSIDGALNKLKEETEELSSAIHSGTQEGSHSIQAEIGDALFILTKIAQMSHVDPEQALHEASDKFERRFRYVEEHASAPLTDYSEEELISLWKQAKANTSK